MCKYLVSGPSTLYGEVKISPAKNSVLTIICASILLAGEVLIKDCPDILDVRVMCEILKSIGATTLWTKEGLTVNTKNIFTTILPKQKTAKIRASFFMVGPMLARFKTVTVSKPGGCKIGERPLDIHLDGLKKLGASIKENEEEYLITANLLKGAKITLRYPSVGATENLILASVFAKGETNLINVAKEPEVVDLCNYLNACGAKIKGIGSQNLTILGVESLCKSISYTPIPDRIETGTFLLLSYLLDSNVQITNINLQNIYDLTQKINNITCKNSGIYVKIYSDKLYIRSKGEKYSLGDFTTSPYPGFATDLHPIMSAVGLGVRGQTKITETVFDSRFMYLKEFAKMGAKFSLNGNTVTIFGKGENIHGAHLVCPDLRGGASLVVASLSAQGDSVIEKVAYIMRGYSQFDKKLQSLGAKIKLIDGDYIDD